MVNLFSEEPNDKLRWTDFICESLHYLLQLTYCFTTAHYLGKCCEWTFSNDVLFSTSVPMQTEEVDHCPGI